MGADLTYECLGGNTYKITVSFYRDCIGISAPSSPYVTISSASCGQTLGLSTYPRPGTGQEVTPNCSTSVTTCNGGSFTGIQEWVYDGIVTLPANCSDWVFSYSLCCRNAAITTITNPGTSTFFIYATLNNLITPCNSSPTFSNKPVPFLCRGQQFCFNHGAYDADGDSLVYELITPKQTATTNVNYLSPYNSGNPLNSSPATSFNTATGDICLTPQALEVTVMAVLVKEYRNGVLIGTVERDLQLTVMNCANSLPSLTGINGTNNFSMTVCANQETCFNIYSSDPDIVQQLTVDWNNAIPGATFTTNSAAFPTANFCWTPGPSDIGNSYTFTATVRDNACPYFGSQTYSYTIHVTGLTVNAGPDQSIACSDLATLTAQVSGGTGPFSYLWSNGSTMQYITVGTGTYWVTASNGSCSGRDTVSVSMPYIPTAAFTNSTTTCINTPIQFTDQSLTPGGVIYQWSWDFGDGTTSLQQNPVHQYAGPGTYQVSLIIENTLGCLDTVQKTIVIAAPPLAAFTAANACLGTSVNFTDQSGPAGTINSWNWNFGNGTSSVLQNPVVNYPAAGTYTATLIVSNANGCRDTIQHNITIYPRPVVNAGMDISICAGASTTLTASGANTYNWTPGGQTGSTISVNPGSTTNYVVTGTDINGCINRDTITVIINPLPTVSAGSNRTICSGASITLTASGANSYLWNPGGSTNGSINVSPVSSTNYTVVGTGANGCTASATVTVTVNSLPNANAGPDRNICAGASATLTASGGTSYLWSPGSSTQGTITVTPGATTAYNVLVTDSNGCSRRDTAIVYVHTPPVVNLQPQFLCSGSTSTLDAGVNAASYSWTPTGDTTRSISINSGGVYTVTVTDAYGCTSSASCNVTVGTSLTINLANVAFCQGDSAVLDAGYPGMTYSWTTGQTTQSIIVHNAGSYGVTVTDPSGCSGSITVTAQSNPRPGPAFTTSAVCEGNNTQFTDATVISNGSIQSWNWNFGDGTNSNSQNPVHAYAVAGNYSVGLTVVSAAGCSSTVYQPVTVNPLPVAAFTANNACIGIAVNFVNQSTVSSGNISTYSWNFGNGISSTQQNPSHVYNNPGNYNVSLQVTTAGGCISTATRTVNIHPRPVAAFTASNACAGTPVQFNNNSSISSGNINSYFWDFNNSNTSTAGSPVHTFNMAGNYTVSLIATSSFGCRDSARSPLTIYANPIANAGSDQQICRGTGVTLNATGGSSYSWSPGSASNASIQVSPLTTTNYTVTVISANGCSASDIVQVSVNPLPIVNAGNDRSICAGNSVTLTASGATSYLWTPGGASTSSIIVSPTVNTNYIVNGTDANGCSNTDTVQVTVNFIPNVTAGPDRVICSGSTVSLTASGASTYSWSPGGATTGTILVNPSVTTEYIVTGTSLAGCPKRDTVQVIVTPIPLVNLVPGFVCAGSSTTLDAGNPGATYAWSTGETTQTISVSDSGSYSVIVTSANGCSSLSSTTVSSGSAINVNAMPSSFCSGQSALLNAGNPGSSYLWSTGASTQSISVNAAGSYSVTITDINGCSATMMHQVTVHPIPVVAFSVPQNCSGQSVLFNNSSSISQGSISSYVWNFGDGTQSAAMNPSHIFSGAGNYTVQLTVQSAAGCTASIQQSAIIHPLPVASFNTAPVCLGQQTLLSDASAISAGAITDWQWFTGTSNYTSSSQIAHTFANAGTHPVTLIVTSDRGCKDTITQSVTVHALPTATISVDNACAQERIQLSNYSVANQGSILLTQWNLGNGSTSGSFAPTVQYPNSGTYPVEMIVINSLGCRDTARTTVTIHPLPQSSFMVNPVCEGSPVSIQNTSSISSGTINATYWTMGDNSSSGQSNPVHTYAQAGTYNLQLISTSDMGCRDTARRALNIYPVPVPSYSVVDACAGQVAGFQDLSSVASGSISNRIWTFSDGTTSSLSNPVHLYQQAGTHNFSLQVISDQGCAASIPGSVNIFPNPVAAFSTYPVCQGIASQFLNQSSVPGGISYTSNWVLSDGSTLSAQHPSHIFSTYGNYTATLQVTTAQGCTAQVVQPLTVYAPPAALFAANDACQGAPTQFNDRSSSRDGSIASWLWNFGDGTTSIEGNPIHSFMQSGQYNVTLTTITTYGCSDAYTDNINIFARPSASIQAADVCQGVPVVFTNASANTTGTGISYVWNLGNGISSTDSTFSYTFPSAGQYSIQLIATSGHGCSTTGNFRINVFPEPNLSATAHEVCLNSATVFQNTSTVNTGLISNWSWDFGDGQTSASQHPAHTYQQAGVYTVGLTATSDRGCPASTQITARINPPPAVSFSNGIQGCAPLNATFRDYSVISSGSISGWLWNFGDGEISTDQHPVHLYTDGGQYDVTLTVVSDKGCQASYTNSGSIKVFAQPLSNFNASPVSGDQHSPTVAFTNLSQGFSSYIWIFGDGTSSSEFNPVHTYGDTGTYSAKLITVNSFGCRDTMLRLIEIRPKSTLYIPNCFTPNNDGKNDFFRPYFTNMEEIEVWVFDRWGLLLASWNSLEGSWNGYYQGKKCQQDVYVYKIKGKGIDGKYSDWVGHVSIVY